MSDDKIIALVKFHTTIVAVILKSVDLRHVNDDSNTN